MQSVRKKRKCGILKLLTENRRKDLASLELIWKVAVYERII